MDPFNAFYINITLHFIRKLILKNDMCLCIIDKVFCYPKILSELHATSLFEDQSCRYWDSLCFHISYLQFEIINLIIHYC